jgi:hypothetical protein
MPTVCRFVPARSSTPWPPAVPARHHGAAAVPKCRCRTLSPGFSPSR